MAEATTTAKEVVGIIDIGSSAIRMLVSEVGAKEEVRHLENLQKSVQLGKDVFTDGKISTPTIRDCIKILKEYKATLETYGVKRIHAAATSAVREAANRDNFIDQVFVRTGIDVEVIEGAEQNRLDLVAVELALHGKVDFEKNCCLIIEVSSGSTEIIIMNKDEVELTRTLSIGSIRLPEQAIAGKTKPDVMQRVLKRSIHGIAEHAGREYSLGQVDLFISLGGDMRFVASQVAEKKTDTFAVVDKKEFTKLLDSISKMSADEIAAQYGMPYADAETLFPTLLFYLYFLNETKSEKIIIPTTSIRDALLAELTQMISGYKRTDLSRQVITSARSLGRKYMYDAAHALCVAQLAIKLFDLLKEEHGLGSRERLLLEVSTILHDIGMYVGASGHHKHSSYLIDAAEIFGLRKSDKDIVTNVARYHRRSIPQPSHVTYMSLPKTDRAIVSKLSAILRVADALDRSHQQKIRNFTLIKKSDSFELWIPEEVGDISIERDGLAKKGGMFGEIFGAAVSLKQGNPSKT